MDIIKMKKFVNDLQQIIKDEHEILDIKDMVTLTETEILIIKLVGERTIKPDCERRIGINYCPDFGNLCTNIQCELKK